MAIKISMQDVQSGYDAWAAKTHNAKWVRRIDGTPIPNDIVVTIFTTLRDIQDEDPTLVSIPEGWVYDADHPMSDGGDTRMTAAEEVLAYLLIEVIGSPDDVPYSPNEAQRILEDRLKEGKRLETSYAELLAERRAALSTTATEGGANAE